MNVVHVFNTDGAGEKASSGADADSTGPGGRSPAENSLDERRGGERCDCSLIQKVIRFLRDATYRR
jgi:hypothetical protein